VICRAVDCLNKLVLLLDPRAFINTGDIPTGLGTQKCRQGRLSGADIQVPDLLLKSGRQVIDDPWKLGASFIPQSLQPVLDTKASLVRDDLLQDATVDR